MTNKEAIKKLKEILFMSGYEEAIDLAIKTLETVETDIEVVAQDAYKQGYTDGWKERFGEPNERPQGEWVSKHLWDNTHAWVCSECGNRNTHGITVEKACWRCGADMRGGAE